MSIFYEVPGVYANEIDLQTALDNLDVRCLRVGAVLIANCVDWSGYRALAYTGRKLTAESARHYYFRIPLTFTDMYQDAVAEYKTAVEMVRAKGISVFVTVRPTDRGLVGIVGSVDHRATYYQLNFDGGDKSVFCPSSISVEYIDGLNLHVNKHTIRDAQSWSDAIASEFAQCFADVWWCVVLTLVHTYGDAALNQLLGWHVMYEDSGVFDRNWVFQPMSRSRNRRLVCIACRGVAQRDALLARCDDMFESTALLASRARAYPLCDRMPSTHPSYCESVWLSTAVFRRPYVYSFVVDSFLALGSVIGLADFELFLLRYVDNARFINPIELSALVSSLYACARTIRKRRTGPARSTRSRVEGVLLK